MPWSSSAVLGGGLTCHVVQHRCLRCLLLAMPNHASYRPFFRCLRALSSRARYVHAVLAGVHACAWLGPPPPLHEQLCNLVPRVIRGTFGVGSLSVAFLTRPGLAQGELAQPAGQGVEASARRQGGGPAEVGCTSGTLRAPIRAGTPPGTGVPLISRERRLMYGPVVPWLHHLVPVTQGRVLLMILCCVPAARRSKTHTHVVELSQGHQPAGPGPGRNCVKIIA